MRTRTAISLAVVLSVLLMLPGCEWRHRDWEADFANTSPTAVDVYRNGELQFTLTPGADGNAHVDRDDAFAVLDHASGQVRGTHTVDISGDVFDIRVTAIIFDDHVDWNTEVDAD